MQVLITGANRGIGLELTKCFLQSGASVIAGVRSPDKSSELKSLGRDYADKLRVLKVDMSSTDQIKSFAKEVGSTPIDVLVNNAGVLLNETGDISSLNSENVLESFKINTIGPIELVKALSKNISRNSKICNMSSKMGSIEDNTSGGYYSYRISKTALNMFTKCAAVEFRNSICVSLHPGWVKTDMGGAGAPLLPDQSAKGLFKVISGLKEKDSGGFFNYDGASIPW